MDPHANFAVNRPQPPAAPAVFCPALGPARACPTLPYKVLQASSITMHALTLLSPSPVMVSALIPAQAFHRQVGDTSPQSAHQTTLRSSGRGGPCTARGSA